MCFPSRRTTSVTFAWVLRPSNPYTTWTFASSKARAAQPGLRGGRPRFFSQVGPVELQRQCVQAAEIQEPIRLVHVRRLKLELSSQQLEHLWRHARIDFEPDHARVTSAAAQLGLNRGEQVFSVAVDVVEVAVDSDAED